MEENKFVSHSLLAEQQERPVLEPRGALNMELQSVKFYVIIVNKATDISKSEHLSLSVRHCTEYIKDILTRCPLDLKKIVGMTFDGTMAMKSLAKKIKSEINECSIFIHYLTHCQELIFKDTTKHCPAMEDAQALYEDLYVIVGISPNRVALSTKFQYEFDSDDVLRLQNLSLGQDGQQEGQQEM